jgi:hypothetical protein
MTIPHEPTLPMPPVMSHEEWMTMTKVSWKVRGSRLKELDAAIDNFHKSKSERALVKVAEALLAWIDQSHPNGDFLQSKRNSNQAVGLLLPVLSWFFSDPKRREMIEALNYLRELYRQQEMTLYPGKRLEFKLQTRGNAGKFCGAVLDEILKFVIKVGNALGILDGEAKNLAQNPEFQRRFGNAINIVIGTSKGISDISGSRHGGGPLGMLLDIIPGLRLASAGVSLYEAFQAKRKSDLASLLCANSSPEYTFIGLSELFQREVQKQASRVVSAAVDITRLFVPGMQLASLIQNVALLSLAIADFVRDYREMQAANAILEGQGPLTPEIFSVCPVLAAYHICSLDTAGTALFIFNDRDQFLSYNFVEKVERYSKGILDPIKIQARTLLHKSDLQLVPGGIPLVSLASDPARLAEQHGWFWWTSKTIRRSCPILRSKPIFDFSKNFIAGPTPEPRDSKAA